jgi:hypothetical protein
MRRERVTIAEQTPKRTRVAVKLGEMRGIYCVREEMNGLRNVYTAIDVVGYCVRYWESRWNDGRWREVEALSPDEFVELVELLVGAGDP